jgi:adenosylmethionine-8-amino-7-oxononanoate aminotransferase
LTELAPSSGIDLQQAAKDHLWLHFTRMGGYGQADVPIIVRGDGCQLWDSNGKRYLDALAGLFSVNIGYGYGEEIGQAALEQMRELPFYTNWSYAHPRAIELAAELAELSINGIPELREPFEPLVPEVRHVSNTNRYHRPAGETEAEFTRFLLDELEQTILEMGPETVCLVHMEPVQTAGGSFVAPEGYWAGVRELCTRYDILLSADEVITGFGRLGYWFGSERYDIRPDIVTCAKGLSSSYAAIGAVITTDAVLEPFLSETGMWSHGITFGGHPVMSAIALKNIDIMKRERIVEHVRETEDEFRSTLEQLLALPIVGDVRGAGYLLAIELVKNKETRETFSGDESEWLLRGFLSGRLFERGLICRADDRGDPVLQISPPLVAGRQEFDEIAGILGDVLSEASQQIR